MPMGLEGIYTKMTMISKSLREIASDLDELVDAALTGSEQHKFASSGKLEEGRFVEEIDQSRSKKGVRVIKSSLGR